MFVKINVKFIVLNEAFAVQTLAVRGKRQKGAQEEIEESFENKPFQLKSLKKFHQKFLLFQCKGT